MSHKLDTFHILASRMAHNTDAHGCASEVFKLRKMLQSSRGKCTGQLPLEFSWQQALGHRQPLICHCCHKASGLAVLKTVALPCLDFLFCAVQQDVAADDYLNVL